MPASYYDTGSWRDRLGPEFRRIRAPVLALMQLVIEINAEWQF
jgi:hypothetical protein